MGFKKVCVYGFGQNEYFFMLPAIRYVLGEIKPVRIVSLDEIREKKSENHGRKPSGFDYVRPSERGRIRLLP